MKLRRRPLLEMRENAALRRFLIGFSWRHQKLQPSSLYQSQCAEAQFVNKQDRQLFGAQRQWQGPSGATEIYKVCSDRRKLPKVTPADTTRQLFNYSAFQCFSYLNLKI